MTDIEKAEAKIQQLIACIDTEDGSIISDLIAEAVKEYGELRSEAGYEDGYAWGFAHGVEVHA